MVSIRHEADDPGAWGREHVQGLASLITRDAVRQLFEARGFDDVGDGVPRVDGLTEDEYFERLNQAQKDQDVLAEWPTEIPTYGTSVPAAWDGDVPWPADLKDRAATALRRLMERIGPE